MLNLNCQNHPQHKKISHERITEKTPVSYPHLTFWLGSTFSEWNNNPGHLNNYFSLLLFILCVQLNSQRLNPVSTITCVSLARVHLTGTFLTSTNVCVHTWY